MAKHGNQEKGSHPFRFVSTETNKELAEKAFSLDGFSLAELGQERPLAYIEDGLNEEIIGQPAAIESLVTALYRENFRNPNRPIAVLMFLGPTGVGKSETAKVLSRLLQGDDSALVAINCSEISENHRVSALLGASPEYVGREQEPLLDRKKIETPRSVVLFDEIEKGAPALRDLLLQICDEGEVTLLKDGKKVSFRNSFVIITSNIGATEMQKLLNPHQFGLQNGSKGQPDSRDVENTAIKTLLGSGVLRPELINRIDDKIVFNPLNDNELEQVLESYVNKTNSEYHKQGIHLSMSPELQRELVKSCDKGEEDRRVFGARPILHKYRKLVEGIAAKLIASGGIRPGSHIHTVVEDESIDKSLQDRIKVYHKKSDAFATKTPKILELESGGAIREIANLPAVINKGSNTAIGLAAAAGIAALFVGDYLNSRRIAKKA